MGQIIKEKNYFLSFLFLKFSGYQNLDPFSNTLVLPLRQRLSITSL